MHLPCEAHAFHGTTSERQDMKAIWYRDTRVSKSSDLGQALEAGDQQRAANLHAESMATFKRTYPQCTPEWFQRVNQQGKS